MKTLLLLSSIAMVGCVDLPTNPTKSSMHNSVMTDYDSWSICADDGSDGPWNGTVELDGTVHELRSTEGSSCTRWFDRGSELKSIQTSLDSNWRVYVVHNNVTVYRLKSLESNIVMADWFFLSKGYKPQPLKG